MSPKEYEHYEAFTDFSAKDTALEKLHKRVIKAAGQDIKYQLTDEDVRIVTEQGAALKRLKVAKKALGID